MPLAGPQGFAAASSTSSSHEGWEPDAQLCASVSPSAKHGKAGGGGGGCWAGAEGGHREPDWVLAGHWHCSPPHRCLLDGHRCLPASTLRAQDQAPRFILTFYVLSCCKPPALPTWEKVILCPQQLQRDGGGMGQESMDRPPDMGTSPVATPTTEMWLLKDLPAFPGLHSGVAPQQGPQPCTPLPSPQPPLCTSFSASVSLARRRSGKARRLAGAALSPRRIA